MTEESPIIVTVTDGVATLTLNRPDKLNAITLDMDRRLFETLRSLEDDEAVRVIVVTGAGRAFCAGVDLSGGDVFGDDAHAAHDATLGTSSATIDERAGLWRFRTPIIGAINGAAIGAGLTLTTLFDLNVVAENAKLGFVFTRRGILPDANIHWSLPRMIGTQRALDLLLTGRMFLGTEAAEIGLALKAVPAEDVLATALEIAHDIAANTSPAAVGVSKQLVYANLNQLDPGATMRQETALVWWLGTEPDAMEGVMSFMEKRQPQWKLSKHIALPEGVTIAL